MADSSNQLKVDVEEAVQPPKGIGARLRRYFFTGIVVTAPIVITLWGAWWFLTFIDGLMAKLIPAQYNPNTYIPFEIPGIGLVITIIFFILVGWFARNVLGRMIIRLSEWIVGRMPVVSTVYNALKQVFDMTIGEHSKAFREVVLFEYPKADCWTIGFVTGVTKEVQQVSNGEVVNVYIPCTPTTAGYLIFLPKEKLIYLTMTPEEAVKLIVSGGVITPPVRVN